MVETFVNFSEAAAIKRMADSGLFMAREKFSVPVKCGRCGQQGTIVWEENVGFSLSRGPQTMLAAVSS
jgi:hypothetical protein